LYTRKKLGMIAIFFRISSFGIYQVCPACLGFWYETVTHCVENRVFRPSIRRVVVAPVARRVDS
jgi:hypothetical protein